MIYEFSCINLFIKIDTNSKMNKPMKNTWVGIDYTSMWIEYLSRNQEDFSYYYINYIYYYTTLLLESGEKVF